LHRTLQAAAALGAVLTALCGSAQAAGRQVSEFPLREQFALPDEIASAGGALWVTDSSLGAVWRVTTKGKARFIDVGSQATGITVGPDGDPWVTDASGSAIVHLALDGTPTRFPLAADRFPADIAAGGDGALWFTETHANAIGRITLDGSISEYPLPVPGAFAADITPGPDGALWVTEQTGNAVDRVALDGTVTRFPLARPNQLPGPIVAGPDGALWFAERNEGLIARMTTDGVVTAEYPLPHPEDDPFELAIGPDGALWISLLQGDAVARMTLDGTVTRQIGLPGGRPIGLTTGPDGALWVAEASGHVARVEIGFDPAITAVPAPFSALAGVPFAATVARFDDADPTTRPQDYAVSIDWGDGTTSSGTVRRGDAGFSIRGEHAFPLPGTFRVVVRLLDAATGKPLARVVSRATVTVL
jgi:virginiamycin B lyase